LGKTVAKVAIIAGPVIGVPLVYFALAGVFALGLMLLGAKTTFKKILSVHAWVYCGVTSLLSGIVLCAALLVRDRDSLSELNLQDIPKLLPTNLGFLVHVSDARVLSSVASSLDVFSIWKIYLLTLGFAAISGSRKTSKFSIAMMVIGLWVVWILLAAGLASLGIGG
jgi:hypothetical protein